MNVKDIENEIMILEEKQWECKMTELYDSDWFEELQVRINRHRDILSIVDKANELLELIRKVEVKEDFRERLKACIGGDFITEDEDLEV